MDIQPVTYRGQTVAACTPTRVFLADHIEALPPGDPQLNFIVAMALYAHDIAHGHIPGPYSDDHARRYAWAFFIPDELLERERLDIPRAAAWLKVPAEELAAAHAEHSAHRPVNRRT
jgi:hypothetical protein